jgi:ribosomal protein S18 acetylase RimI-like enzyme
MTDASTPLLPLRLATSADVPALVALVNASYRGDTAKAGWTHEADLLGGIRIEAPRMDEMLRDPRSAVLVHDDGGEIIACVHLERIGDDGVYLGMLTVRPTLQASGLGRRLLAASEADARARWGATHVEMTVIALRSELIAWYERRGYSRTGERRPFPADAAIEHLRDGIDFIVLRKAL